MNENSINNGDGAPEAAGGGAPVPDGSLPMQPQATPTQPYPAQPAPQYPAPQYMAPPVPHSQHTPHGAPKTKARKGWWTIPKVVVAGAIAVLLAGAGGGAIGYGIGEGGAGHHGFANGQFRGGHYRNNFGTGPNSGSQSTPAPDSGSSNNNP
ncbi:hypothetical protein AL755_14230 [Arthrobacter sp. ERGS1:01]|uniref:hypothetical protein n=1 Tax=Arthrobacter sp. ERGS1:01 TaxID=1704044 RepID=UPI0006B45686|nr:hypothetical protein [Arthrobacter sp. ERGS1:01]ALE06351.1 hypothetical protein AL755_14230 [Arthrobacter sp. ERGS1:01]